MSNYGEYISRAIETGKREIEKTAASHHINSPLPSDFPSEVQKAANILASFTDPEKTEGGLDHVIPKDVILNAKGLVIFTVFKAGIVWTGRAGSGLIIAKTEDGKWSPPSCISVLGVGFGAQAGADVTDHVCVLNTPEAVKAFSHGENVTLGGNLSVSAGPSGKGTEISGSIYERKPLFSYCKSKGLFVGASVEGTGIIERKEANKIFYNKEVSAEEILSGKVETPSVSNIDVLYDVIKRAETRDEQTTAGN